MGLVSSNRPIQIIHVPIHFIGRLAQNGFGVSPIENSNILHCKITSTKIMVWTPDRQNYSSHPPQGKDMDP